MKIAGKLTIPYQEIKKINNSMQFKALLEKAGVPVAPIDEKDGTKIDCDIQDNKNYDYIWSSHFGTRTVQWDPKKTVKTAVKKASKKVKVKDDTKK